MALLALAGDPARRPRLTLGLLAAACLCLAALVRGAARSPLSAGAVLGAAALLRLLMLPLPPALSTDVWRYLWDGRLAMHHRNPYLLRPDDPALAGQRDALWQRLEHRDVPTVYPPLAMALFVLPAGLAPRAGMVAWKLLVALVDLGSCALLLRLADEAGWPRQRVLWYAAHPLVALEVAGMGHLEPMGVTASVLVALWLRRGRASGAGAAAAAAGLAKLIPFAAVPMWARQARGFASRERRADGAGAFLLTAVGLSALALWPVATTAGSIPPGLATYALRWEFGGPLHEPLWRLLAAARAPEALKHGLDLMKERVGMHALWNRIYPWAYPQLLSRLLLAAGAAALVARSCLSRHRRWSDPVTGGAALFGGLLLCSPTVYPWYLLWVLPWAALTARAPWLLAAALAPLLYVPALVGVPLWPWIHLAVWAPPLALWVVERWRRPPS